MYLRTRSKTKPGVIAVPNLSIIVCEPTTFEPIKLIETHNDFLSWGRNNLRALMGYPSLSGDGGTIGYLAIGTDNTAVTDVDQSCVAETFRKAITRRVASVDGSGNVAIRYQLYVDNNEANGGGTENLKEAALHTTDGGGSPPVPDIWTRAIYSTIPKTSSIALIYDWEIAFASA